MFSIVSPVPSLVAISASMGASSGSNGGGGPTWTAPDPSAADVTVTAVSFTR
jgi:hypothetical protein